MNPRKRGSWVSDTSQMFILKAQILISLNMSLADLKEKMRAYEREEESLFLISCSQVSTPQLLNRFFFFPVSTLGRKTLPSTEGCQAEEELYKGCQTDL